MCYRLPGVLKEFHRQAPNVRLLLRSMNCYEIRDGLLDGSLDLGVFYSDVEGLGSSLVTYPVGTYPVALLASPEVSRQFPDFITPDRTFPVPFIINEKNCVFRQIFEQYLRSKAISPDHTIELWSIPTIKNLVKSNVGITFLPVFAAEEELDRGELAEIPTANEHKEISAVCANHKNKWISQPMQLFIELCQTDSH